MLVLELFVSSSFYDNINYNSNNNGEKSLFVQRFSMANIGPPLSPTPPKCKYHRSLSADLILVQTHSDE